MVRINGIDNSKFIMGKRFGRLVDLVFSVLLIVSLLSFPFVIKFFFPPSFYQALLALVFVVFLFALILSNPPLQITWRSMSVLTKVVLIVYLAYISLIILSALAHSGEPYVFEPTIRILLKTLFLYLVFFFVSNAGLAKGVQITLSVFVIAAVGAIILWFLIFFGMTQPVGTLSFQAATGETERSVYVLGMTWGELGGPGFVGTLTRLQSFSDEPGNFAFPLLVVLLWAMSERRWWTFGIGFVALCLTLSFGAIVFALAVGMTALWTGYRAAWLRVAIICFASLVFLLIYMFYDSPLLEFFARYFESKVSSVDQSFDNSSFGARLVALKAIFDVASENILGLGVGARGAVFKMSVGAEFFMPLLEGGFPAFFAYCLFVFSVVAVAFQAIKFSGKQGYVTGIAVLALVFASFQRSRIDDTFWHLSILIWMLRTYEANNLGNKIKKA